MPLQATSGAASYDAFGGGVAAVPQYIEDVFSTFVYAGNSTNRSIVNDIDLSGKGGLVWIKDRNFGLNHTLFDTARGATKFLSSDNTNAEGSASNTLTAFNSNGFNLGTNSGYVNGSGYNYVSWTFREQAKFFDVVTYTGNSVAGREIAHNLGSVPGCMIVKSTSDTQDWAVYHRSLGNTKRLVLNGTDAEITSTVWNNTTPTSTVFTVSDNARVNSNGSTYVAYLFAHNAGGFGLTGTDNVISCGSYGSNTTDVNLGYEPQWIMIKNTTSGIAYAGWAVFDNMRGLSMISTSNPALLANSSTAEYGTYNGAEDYLTPTATGFKLGAGTTLVGGAGSSGTWIYIAIRRGPMKVPTSGTSVFSPNLETVADGTGTKLTTNFPVDLQIMNYTPGTSSNSGFLDRLRGIATTTTESGQRLISSATSAEASASVTRYWDNTGFQVSSAFNNSRTIYWNFQRAPSFFDEVCYTGNGSSPGQTLNHNLNAVPELIIWKARSNGVNNWYVYNATVGTEFYVELNTTIAKLAFSLTGSRTPTSTVFHTCTGGDSSNNGNNITYVAYLFATCAGVSKCTAFTGTGTLQTINCGFTAGSRFVLIKRTDAAGDWYVWDSSRGLSSSTDPYLLLNSTAAEVTSTNWVDTTSTGFQVTAASGNNVNINGASYIALAIA